MAIVAVTGVTGRVGANVARALLVRGYGVRGIVRPGSPRLHRLRGLDIELAEADLRDTDAAMTALANVDGIVHCAAVLGKPEPMSDREYFDSNATATWNVAFAASKVAPNLRRLVYTSTDATYSTDQARYLPIDEQHPQTPNGAYGLTKMLGEQIVLHFRRQVGLPSTVARIGFVMLADQILSLFTAGEAMKNLHWYDHPRSKVRVDGVPEPWKLIEQAVGDPSTLLIPRGLDGRSWVHHPTDMHDTVAGLVLMLEHEAAIGEAFNIFASSPTSWEAGARYVHERTGRPIAEVRLPNYWEFGIDIGKAKRLLGYDPQYDVRRMIDEALVYQDGADIGVIP
jgi:UDP-glucose 4-epimerase